MHIYQPFITRICSSIAYTPVDTDRDFEIAALIAVQAHTIVFSADQALALRPALERFAESVDYGLPFPEVILQFDRPVPEREFFTAEHAYQNDPEVLASIDRIWREEGQPLHGWMPADGDALVALLLGQDDIDGVLHNHAVAFFASTAVNRVHWSCMCRACGWWSEAERKEDNVATVLMIIAPARFRDEELFVTQEELEMAGHTTVIASLAKGPCPGSRGGQAIAALTLAEICVENYATVVFVGGGGSKVYFGNSDALRIAQEANEKGKVVAAICLAPVILANAGVLKGKHATVAGTEARTIEAQGAHYTGPGVMVDGNIVTGNAPKCSRLFGQRIGELLNACDSRTA